MATNRGSTCRRQWFVGLVSMPFKDLLHPPIQLGILESALERAGIAARSHSLELAFMEHLHARTSETADGKPLAIEDYQQVALKAFVVQLGDWIFKVPPFAESAADDEAYLDYVRGETSEREIINAARMRSLVPEFLEAAADELLAGSPRIIGFSSVFQQNVSSLVLAKILKTRDPSLTIVFGGDNCDGPMGAALHNCFPWVDVVVRGEGERVLVEIAKDIMAGRSIRPQPGICHRVDGRSVAVPESNRPDLPMDEVPTPTYDEYFERIAESPLGAELWPDIAILFESSRGCWWGAKSHCTFCGLKASTMLFRSRSAVTVAREILDLAARYRVLNFAAVDDIIDLAHIRDLLPLLKESGCDLQIFYETKANLNKDQIRAFHDAGVTEIQPGIESLSTPILRLMRKGLTALNNIRLLKWCAEIGVEPQWNLLYGFPDEPPEEYDRMADLIPSLVHLDPPLFRPIQIQRFSPYFERAADFGIEIVGPMPYYRFLYPVPPPSLSNLVYDFQHRYRDGRDPSSYTQRMKEATDRWRESAASGLKSLSYRRGPGFLIVNDRRPGLEEADYEFEDVEAKIYLACDAGATVERIRSLLLVEDDGAPETDEIQEFVDDLVSARLMYREGNSYLSLAIAETGDTSAGGSRPAGLRTSAESSLPTVAA
jgi:ribosomal peptide maturation radical SAM protein 1